NSMPAAVRIGHTAPRARAREVDCSCPRSPRAAVSIPSRTLPAATGGRTSVRLIAALVILGAVVASATVPAPWKSAAPARDGQGAPVRRGPLRIAVTASGNLKSADTTRLTSGVEGRTTILTLAPEG